MATAFTFLLLALRTLDTIPGTTLRDALWHAVEVLGFPPGDVYGVLRHLAGRQDQRGAEAKAAALALIDEARALFEGARERLSLHPTSTLHLALAQAADEQGRVELVPLALWNLPETEQGSDAADLIDAALKVLGPTTVPASAPTVPAPPLEEGPVQQRAGAAAYFRNALALALRGARLVEGDDVLEAEAHHVVLALEAMVRGLSDRVDAERAELAEQAGKQAA